MKTNTILKWLVLPASTFVLIGCGGGGGGSASGSVATGQAFYVDSAVQGVDYNCGSQVGVTGSKGEFTFEIGQSCTFSLDKIKLRDVAADQLENGKQIQETNVKIAQVLQSLDDDRNPDNGISIDADIVKSLIESGVSTFTDIFNVWSSYLPGTSSSLVSEAAAKVHLIESIVKEHTLYTNIYGQAHTLESWTFNADMTSVGVVEIEGGSDTETVSISFDSGTFTFSTSSDRIKIEEITEDYMRIAINGDETRLYYDEAKARDYFLN